jgi:hypothetical protein
MNIEPSLQSFMDRHITIARATFGKDLDDDVLTNTTLLTFAGMGLAKCVFEGGDPTWVRTDRLVELEKTPAMPVDLTPFMATPVDQGNAPQMTESLRIIIADMIEIGQQTHPERAENITVDSTLLYLAGQELASFMEAPDKKWIWRASPRLIDYYEMGEGIDSLAMGRRPKIKTDDLLKSLSKSFSKKARADFGYNLPRRVATILTLLSLEVGGQAIVYIDEEGRLAWKASDNLRRDFE